MIDTDKYKGHKTAPWRWWSGRLLVDADNYGLPLFQLNGEPNELDTPDVHLIADAPLLLEEVKRLHTEFQEMLADFQNVETDMWRMRDRIEAILKGEY